MVDPINNSQVSENQNLDIKENVVDDSDVQENATVEDFSKTESQEQVEDLPLSPVELEAYKKGWRPKEQFRGSEEDFRGPKEFLEKKQFIDSLSESSRAVRQLKDHVEFLTNLTKKQQEQMHEDRINFYKNQKKAAIEISSIPDVEKFDAEIAKEEEAIRVLKEDKLKTNQLVEETQKYSPAVSDFGDRNKDWFGRDRQMTKYAVDLESYLSQSKPDWTEEKRLKYVEKAVRDQFSGKFENKNRDRASSVNIKNGENRSSSLSKTSKITMNDVPYEMRSIIIDMSKTSNMNVDAYLQQLVKTGVIKK